MNERIFELAKQADFIQWDTLPSGARTPDHESVVKAKKFAELIVRMCADAADMAQDAGCEYAGDYVAEYMGFGQEHGVTEWRAK
jgi:hypothetical protein